MDPKCPLATAVAATLTMTAGPAAATSYAVTLNQFLSYSASGASSLNITSSTATWAYDFDTGVLSQTGGTFNARFTIVPTTTLFRYSTTGLVIGAGAAATSFTCTDGNFGPSVGASICGNYNFGANFINESTVSWGPGTATARSIGGDDMALGSVRGVDEFNGTSQVGDIFSTFMLTNRSCNPLVPGGSQNCSTVGGWNTGYTWVFQTPLAVPVPAAAWLFGSALGVLGYARRRNAGV